MGRDFRQQADLVDRMAKRLGVDLEEAVLQGDLRMGDLSEAIIGCAGCPDPGHCQHWLAEAEARAAQSDAAPGYCRNRDLLAGLRQRAT